MTLRETSAEEMSRFHELSIKNPHSFLLFDQINKKLGAEIYQMTNKCFRAAIFLKLKKLKII